MKFLSVCSFLMAVASTSAQTPTPLPRPSETPVSVTISGLQKTLTKAGTARLAFQLNNTSGKDIIAFVVRVATLDENNTELGTTCNLSMQGGNKTWPASLLSH